MGHFVEQNLLPGEIIKYEAKVSIWGQFPWIVIGVLTLPWLVGLLPLLIAYLNYSTTELVITDKKIMAKYGFISRVSAEIFLEKIETVSVDQGVIGRMFNFGTVSIAGAGIPVPIKGISDPILFRKRFFEVKESKVTANA